MILIYIQNNNMQIEESGIIYFKNGMTGHLANIVDLYI
jgi:hypothetical protein